MACTRFAAIPPSARFNHATSPRSRITFEKRPIFLLLNGRSILQFCCIHVLAPSSGLNFKTCEICQSVSSSFVIVNEFEREALEERPGYSRLIESKGWMVRRVIIPFIVPIHRSLLDKVRAL